MKKLLIVLCVLTIPVYLFLGFVFRLASIANNLYGVYGDVFEALTYIGGLTALVGVIGALIGIFFVVKDKNKRGIVCALAGMAYAVVIMLGFTAVEALNHNQRLEMMDLAEREIYGADWDAASNIAGIPPEYEVVLNKYYVAVKEHWDTERLMDYGLYAWKMPEYYGETGVDNIGFALIDLDHDGRDELILGTIQPVADAGNEILLIMADQDNPHPFYACYDNQYAYFHNDGSGGYLMEHIIHWEDGTILTEYSRFTDMDNFEEALLDSEPDSLARVHVPLTAFAVYK